MKVSICVADFTPGGRGQVHAPAIKRSRQNARAKGYVKEIQRSRRAETRWLRKCSVGALVGAGVVAILPVCEIWFARLGKGSSERSVLTKLGGSSNAPPRDGEMDDRGVATRSGEAPCTTHLRLNCRLSDPLQPNAEILATCRNRQFLRYSKIMFVLVGAKRCTYDLLYRGWTAAAFIRFRRISFGEKQVSTVAHLDHLRTTDAMF